MDRALRGNRLTKKPKTQQPSPRMGQAGPKARQKAPITSFAEEVDAGPTEMLGIHVRTLRNKLNEYKNEGMV